LAYNIAQIGKPPEDIDISLLQHVSPIEWQNVIFYGQYVLNPDAIR
jgi:hypothetical protein